MKDRDEGFDNAAWVETTLKITLTPFQRRVADIIGTISRNAYNAPVRWDEVNWQWGGAGVMVEWLTGRLASYDLMNLTMLVFLCHDARIRVQVECGIDSSPLPEIEKGEDPMIFRTGHIDPVLRLCFWQRHPADLLKAHHPDLDEAIAEHREYFGSRHRLLYRNHEERRPAPLTDEAGARIAEDERDARAHDIQAAVERGRREGVEMATRNIMKTVGGALELTERATKVLIAECKVLSERFSEIYTVPPVKKS